MASKQTRTSDHNIISFFYLALIFVIFFLFQLKFAFTETIENWDSMQYTLLFFMFVFIIICLLKYRMISTEAIHELKALDLQEKTVNLRKTSLYQQVMAMNPYDFSELVGDLFRAKGYKRIFSHPKVAHLFHDIEMYREEQKVFVSCKLLPNQQQVNQAYLDRLFLQMRNLNVDEGIFVTLSDFTPECYEFVQNKSITLINGDTLLEELLKYSDL